MHKYCLLFFSLIVFVMVLSLTPAQAQRLSKGKTIFVFYKTAGFYHPSIPNAVKALQLLGRENGIKVDTSSDARHFSKRGLRKYGAVVFLNTTGDVLNDVQQRAFVDYIKSGKGFVGIHSAASTELGWAWFRGLVGASLQDHPEVQPAIIHVVTNKHPATSSLPERWERTDEWYNLKNIRGALTILATVDESSYKGGKNGAGHPFAWFQEYEGGRSFYTSGGHTDLSYTEPLFLSHILGGIRYALGSNEQ